MAKVSKLTKRPRRARVDRNRKLEHKAVRGPQLDLFGGRTPRMRFIERPAKVQGNPFFAVRVPREVLAAFKRKARPNPQAAVRAFMAKLAGVKLEVADVDA